MHLDALAADGVQLTSFITTPYYSQTRARLLTGVDQHLVEVGAVPGDQAAFHGPNAAAYVGELNDTAPTLAERVQADGYASLFSGKWHLGSGGPQKSMPGRAESNSVSLRQRRHTVC